MRGMRGISGEREGEMEVEARTDGCGADQKVRGCVGGESGGGDGGAGTYLY